MALAQQLLLFLQRPCNLLPQPYTLIFVILFQLHRIRVMILLLDGFQKGVYSFLAVELLCRQQVLKLFSQIRFALFHHRDLFLQLQNLSVVRRLALVHHWPRCYLLLIHASEPCRFHFIINRFNIRLHHWIEGLWIPGPILFLEKHVVLEASPILVVKLFV